jgi:hypothetical protein
MTLIEEITMKLREVDNPKMICLTPEAYDEYLDIMGNDLKRGEMQCAIFSFFDFEVKEIPVFPHHWLINRVVIVT